MSGDRRTLLVLWGGAGTAVVVLVALLVVVLLPAPAAVPAADPGLGVGSTEAGLLSAVETDHITAPGFRLTDQHGRAASLAALRGKAVVLTFDDDRCTDICTLLAQDVIAADRDLGTNARDVRFVAINANPYYPAPADTAAWTDRNDLGRLANWTFDTGTPTALAAAAKAYGTSVTLHPATRTIDHGTDIVFIAPDGEERAVGLFGTEAADTDAFGHALADEAVSMLPAAERHPVSGAVAARGAVSSSPGAFRLAALTGSGTVSASRGRYTVLDFFSSTCAACTTEAPAFEAEYRALHGRVAFVGVDVDDRAAAGRAAVAAARIGYPVGVDPSGVLAARFGVVGLPFTVVLDPRGRVVTSHDGVFTRTQLDYLLGTLTAGD